MTQTLRGMIAAAREAIAEVPPASVHDARLREEIELVIDVREPDEFAGAHIRDSVNVPRGMLELRADADAPSADPALSAARSKRIVLYCTKSPSARSLLAAQTLRSMGFESVEVLDGGLNAWTEAGLPVEP